MYCAEFIFHFHLFVELRTHSLLGGSLICHFVAHSLLSLLISLAIPVVLGCDVFLGHVNDLELFLRQIVMAGSGPHHVAGSRPPENNFLLSFLFLLLFVFISIDCLLPFASPTRAVFGIPELKNARLLYNLGGLVWFCLVMPTFFFNVLPL